MRYHRPAVFEVQPITGCIVCTSHKTDAKGYLIKRFIIDGKRLRERMHRFTYRSHYGLENIPNGYEIDHICRNRACCNVKHLRMLEVSDHKSLTNMQRSEDRIELALMWWLVRVTADHQCTGQQLADEFKVSQTTSNRWIRMWKEDEDIIPLLPKTADSPSGPF